ncbi:hypothetical protein RV15_GL002285 [Enterococcus silesiacus]|nr:hypothetical protein RV15_GL002285 [Enterococcus silesiacus]
MTILKKRYGLVLMITSLSIILFYTYMGVSDLNHWKDTNTYYNSEQYLDDLRGMSEDDNPRYTGLSLKERQELDKKEGLNLFYQVDSYDEQGKLETTSPNDDSYFTMYFNENPLLLLAIVVAAGFFVFFVDLRTSFNEFLFSLGVSKRRIYFSKFALISLPLLGSILLAKILFVSIITTGIPAEYVNISMMDLLANVLASWTTYILYFFIAAFIGLVTGNLILGPLTALGFCLSLEFFITAVINAWYYFTKTTTDLYVTNKFFVYTVEKAPISILPVIVAIVLPLLVLAVGSYLFPTLTLEKKGNYLLFDTLKIPVVIAMVIYVPIVLVFNHGYYSYENGASPIPGLLIYGIITALIGSYLVFRKEIHGSINRRRQVKNSSNVKS